VKGLDLGHGFIPYAFMFLWRTTLQSIWSGFRACFQVDMRRSVLAVLAFVSTVSRQTGIQTIYTMQASGGD
jgi:hypothetical protein